MSKPNKKLKSKDIDAKSKAESTETVSSRVLKPSIYHKFLPKMWRSPKVVRRHKVLPSGWALLIESIALLRSQWKPFLGIVSVYTLATVILVTGLSIGSQYISARETIDQTLPNQNPLTSLAVEVFYLFGKSNSNSAPLSGIYQSILLTLGSLAIIWGLRKAKKFQAFTVKEAFYKSTNQLLPFILVVAIMSIQLLPFSIMASIYNMAITNGVVVSGLEQLLFLVLLAISGFWSFRMITGTIFAPYIATLPDLEPIHAVRSASELVGGRRLILWRKFVFLMIALLVLVSLAITPFILLMPLLAPWAFLFLIGVALALSHAYLFVLYRELLGE